jgi:putative phosphoribosyl transferase
MFEDREAAGVALSRRLAGYAGRSDVVILGLPRGGVPVAYQVARALAAPLDILVVRKLGVPFQPELAMGAIASGGGAWLNQDVIRMARVRPDQLEQVIEHERAELARRERTYRSKRAALDLRGRTVILVDDGMATGASLYAAAQAVRSLAPAKLIAAVPVAPMDAADRMADAVDEFVCVETPDNFRAVGQFYRRFDQTSDDEVRECLAAAARAPGDVT